MIKSEETIHAPAEVAESTSVVAVNDHTMTSARKPSAASERYSSIVGVGSRGVVQCAVNIAVGSRASS